MSEPILVVETGEGVATVTLNRPLAMKRYRARCGRRSCARSRR
jgi:hypothetical protein